MNCILNANSNERWAIILAGGDGSRLMPLCRRITGCSVPKQFCRIFGRTTLLGQTRWRVSLLVPPTRILTVVNRAHESLYSPLLKGTPRITSSCSLKIRGPAAAIVYALRRLSELNPCASVVTDARGASLWANWIRRSEINENATLFPAGQRSTEQKSDPLAGKECRHDPPP